MPSIRLLAFRGERPTIAPRLLDNECATIAKNCKFNEGNLSPYKAPLEMNEELTPRIKTIWKYQDKHWFKFERKTDVVASPLAADPWGRVYFTSKDGLRVTNNQIFQGGGKGNMPVNSHRLGIDILDEEHNGAAKVGPITAVVNNPAKLPAVDDPADDETRFYVFTLVTDQGEESGPSPVSGQLEIKYPNSTVTITLPTFPKLSGNITKVRIYRSATGGGTADFFLVVELPIATKTYTDSLKDYQLDKPLITETYEPPNPKINTLTLMANGILAGGYENNVCFSEPYIPHAWPRGYQLTTEYEIVAMCSVGNLLVVGTKGYPEIFQGVSSDAMSGRKLESMQACVSKESMVNIDNLVVYASPHGLVAFTGQDVTLVTEPVIDSEQWKALEPETIEAYYYDGKYLAFYGKALDKSFVFDPRTGDMTFYDIGSNCGYTDLVTGYFYMRGPSGTKLAAWNSGDNMSYQWRSKEYYGLYPSFNTLYVRGKRMDEVGARVIADGKVIHDYAPATLKGKPIRVPAKRGDTWQFEIYGTGVIEQVSLATSVMEV